MDASRNLVVPDRRAANSSPPQVADHPSGCPNTKADPRVSADDASVKFVTIDGPLPLRSRAGRGAAGGDEEWSQGESNPRYRRERPVS